HCSFSKVSRNLAIVYDRNSRGKVMSLPRESCPPSSFSSLAAKSPTGLTAWMPGRALYSKGETSMSPSPRRLNKLFVLCALAFGAASLPTSARGEIKLIGTARLAGDATDQSGLTDELAGGVPHNR